MKSPGLGSPAGVAWGGVESLASVWAVNVPSLARVPANGRTANESRSRGQRVLVSSPAPRATSLRRVDETSPPTGGEGTLNPKARAAHLLRSGEELRRHGVGEAIRGGRRSLARYPRTGDFITNVFARLGDEVPRYSCRSHVWVRPISDIPMKPRTSRLFPSAEGVILQR
jgi:hypothetical protein